MAVAETLDVSPRLRERLDGEVLTPQDVASILKMNIRTVKRHFETGEIPAKKIGSLWRCRREAFDKFLS